jgi:hypothetical protein
MFAGMALQKAIGGLLQPAQDASGIMDIFGATLTILFIPAMLWLVPIFVWFLEVINGLGDDTKWAIGMVAVLGFVLAGVIMVIGQAVTLMSSLAAAGKAWDAMNLFVATLSGGKFASSVDAAATSLAGLLKSLGPLGMVALTIATLYVTDLIWKNWGATAPYTSENTNRQYENNMAWAGTLGTNAPMLKGGLETIVGGGSGIAAIVENLIGESMALGRNLKNAIAGGLSGVDDRTAAQLSDITINQIFVGGKLQNQSVENANVRSLSFAGN